MNDALNVNNILFSVKSPQDIHLATNQEYIDQQNSTKANKTDLVDYLQKSGGTISGILNVGWGWK